MPEERVELKRVDSRQEVDRDRRGYSRGLASPDPMTDGYGYAADPGYGDAGTEGSSKEILQKLWRAVRRRKWPILAVTLIVTAVVAMEVMRVRPSYTAHAVVEISSDTGFVVGRVVEDAENLIQLNTKILMFDSRSLLENVVVNLKLDQNERFLDVSRKRSRWATLKGLLEDTPSRPPMPEPPAGSDSASTGAKLKRQPVDGSKNPFRDNPKLDRFVSILEAGKNVESLKQTQALEISFTHIDPRIARDVANGLAEAFVQHNLQGKADRFENKIGWLAQSTRELKALVEAAERKLADHSREHNLFSQGAEGPVPEGRLSQLHDQTVRAEMGLVLKQFMYEEVRQGRGAQLPESFTDVRIIELQKRLNDLSVQAAQLSVNYGPENPTVHEVQQQMAKLQEQLDASTARLEAKITSDYALAYRESQALRAALDQAKSEAVHQDQAAVQHNLLKQDVETARGLYNDFLKRSHQTDLEVAQLHSSANVIRHARVPWSADGLNTGMSIAAGFFLSLAASIGLAFGLELLDKTVKNVEDVARYGQLPTLGVIPSMNIKSASGQLKNGKKQETRLFPATANGSAENTAVQTGNPSFRFLRYTAPPKGTNGDTAGLLDRVVLLGERSAIAEAYRGLRTSVLFSTGANAPKTILITSGQPGEGKTTTVINTAISLAQLGASVLIIDADLRKPMTHNGFGLNSDRGLSTYLSSEAELDGLIQRVRIRNLSVLPCGPIPTNPSELINSERMKQLLQTMSERFDHIVIDSPPLMHVTDPVILSTMVDGVILVVRGGKSSRDVVRQSRLMLTNVGANIFGVVLNNVSLKDQPYADFPSYHYDLDGQQQQDEARISNILG